MEKNRDKASGGNKGKIRLVKALGNILYIVCMVFLGLTVIFSIWSKISGNVQPIFGYRVYTVLGGSMEPAIHKGSIIFSKEIEPENLKVGDVIMFISPAYNNKMVTHRITRINDGLSFTTRGDANDTDDLEPVPAADVKGKVCMSVPYVGYVVNFAQTRTGLLLLIIIPSALIILLETLNIIRCSARLKAESIYKAQQAKNQV
ncbi:MAG TPA: signal peptidase I [Clostridia bacterium]|nr:signal peptidase I [Clostridia bacterium]